MKEAVVALAGSVIESADEALLEQLCEAAIAMWKGRLTDGATVEDSMTAFTCAAAFTAAADYCVARQCGPQVDFTAGEISVKGKAAGEVAKAADKLRLAAERLMAPYTGSYGNFAFLGVKG